MYSGFLIGDREMQLIESGKKNINSVYAFDRKNRLFAAIKYGPTSSGLFSKNSDPDDYVVCNIYEVTHEYVEKTNGKEKFSYPQKKDIVR